MPDYLKVKRPSWPRVVVAIIVFMFIVCLPYVVKNNSKKQDMDMFQAGLGQKLSIFITDSEELAAQAKPGTLVVLSNDGIVKGQPVEVILNDFSGRSTTFMLNTTEVNFEISDDIDAENSVELIANNWRRTQSLKDNLECATFVVNFCLNREIYDAIYGS